MTDARRKIAKAMGAASEMRLALAGHVAFDVAARKWDEAAQDAHEAVCSLTEPADPLDDTDATQAALDEFLAKGGKPMAQVKAEISSADPLDDPFAPEDDDFTIAYLKGVHDGRKQNPLDDPKVKSAIKAAILEAQLRAWERGRIDTPDEIESAALAAIKSP